MFCDGILEIRKTVILFSYPLGHNYEGFFKISKVVIKKRRGQA